MTSELWNSNITFFTKDGSTKIWVSIESVNRYNDETVSIAINYGAQVGACIVILLIVLALTPSTKLRRASSVLNISALIVNIVRMSLMFVYLCSPFNHFYETWAQDFSHISRNFYRANVVATTLTFVLVILIEVALMNQAWTMMAFWPSTIKYAVTAISIATTVLTISSRFVFTVVQNKSILAAESTYAYRWIAQWTVVMNAVSISWFCAVFNAKLIYHLTSNRGILPTRTMVNPMEVLIMANGILMVAPVIFAGLEWGQFTNFEPASLTQTSVIIILPLASLMAQHISQAKSKAVTMSSTGPRSQFALRYMSSNVPLKSGSIVSKTGTSTEHQASFHSRADPELSTQDNFDLVGWELNDTTRGDRHASETHYGR